MAIDDIVFRFYCVVEVKNRHQNEQITSLTLSNQLLGQ